MKKTSRKLFAAVASLGLAVAATVGSTYAWFSMNDSVTATGMNVKVQGESTLLIDTAETKNANGRLTNGSSNADQAAEVSSIKPASTTDLGNWFYATAAEANASTAKEGSYKLLSTDDEKNNHRVVYDFYLQVFDKTVAGEATDVEIASKKQNIILDEIKVSAKDSTNLYKSLRVAVAQDSTKLFVAPLYAADEQPTNQGLTDDAGTTAPISWTAKTTAADGLTCDVADTAIVVDTAKYNKVYNVKVYVYFDGEDSSCFTDNIPATLAEYGITLKFRLLPQA